MVKITIYVEGGGQGNSLPSKCREGFSEFFKKAGFAGRMPRIFACGSRNDAYADFCAAVKEAKANEFVVLLVDSEAAITVGTDPWHHLRLRDKWNKPDGATSEQLHLMVECMENWLLADHSLLASYYHKNFNAKALPQNPNIEEISKKDVMRGLQEATKNTQKGSYSKGSHSFDLLKNIDPAKVVDKAPHAQRFIATLQARLNQQN